MLLRWLCACAVARISGARDCYGQADRCRSALQPGSVWGSCTGGHGEVRGGEKTWEYCGGDRSPRLELRFCSGRDGGSK